MWLLTPEEILEASRTKANMPEDWARLQLEKIARVGYELCYNHAKPIVRLECPGCVGVLWEETGAW